MRRRRRRRSRPAPLALTADPALASGPGDRVDIRLDGQRQAIGELRGVAGDAVTVALSERDASAIDPDRRYRLVTRASAGDAGRAFAAVLRRSETTVATVDVAAESDLVGVAIGALAAPVFAIQAAETTAMPADDRAIAGGDRLYCVATPAVLADMRQAAGDRP